MAEGASGGLSQEEIDAAQASRRKKEAAGGGHPSLQGKNKGIMQPGVAAPIAKKAWDDFSIMGILDPAGFLHDRHDPIKIDTDPKAAENKYNQDVLDAMQAVKGLQGQSSADVRARSKLDALAQQGKSGVRTAGGPLGVATGLGAVSRAQPDVSRGAARQVLEDTELMNDILRGMYGGEEQYNWLRALEESERIGTISKVNLGLLNAARAANAQRYATIGVLGAKGYAAWDRGREQEAAVAALRAEQELDKRDSMYGLGDSSGSGTLGPRELDL